MDMQKEREKVLYAVGSLFDLLKEKQAEIDDLKQKLSKASAEQKQAEIDELKAAYSGVNAKLLEQLNINSRLQEDLLGVDSGEWVLVPKECPDQIFADKLFDLLCEKAHGEFGDDQMIFFSDINESEIWEKMIEAAQEQS